MTYKPWPTADQQHDEQGRTDVVGAVLIDPATGQPYAASGGGGTVTVANANPNGQATMANSAPVVLASDQSNVPVKPGSALTVSGLSAGALNADLVPATDISQYGYATITLTGTWTGTLSTQYSDDSSTFTSYSSAYNSGGVAATSITANNQYVIKGFAGRFLRIRMTAYTSGIANATITYYTLINPSLASQFVSAAQNGTWTVQPGNTANTTAWKVDNSGVTQPVSASSLPLPTGASTSAKQPALGTAGTPSADVISVQGVASGTPQSVSGTFWQATQPMSSADGSQVTIGAQADTAATSDTGTFTLMSLVKRLLQSLTTGNTNTTTSATQNTSTATNTGNTSTVLGTTTDAAVTGDNNGSISAKQRGLTKILTDVWNSTVHILQIGRNAIAVYTLASTTTSGTTQNSGDLTVGPYTEISLDLNTTAQAGTSPTIQYFYERKGADGIYYVLWQSAVLTAAANTLSTSIGAGMAYNQSLGLTGRLRWVIGGSATPTFTHSLNMYGK